MAVVVEGANPVSVGRVAMCKTRQTELEKIVMTIRQRIEQHLAANPHRLFTNRELATELTIPEPSVRRMTLKAVSGITFSNIADAGGTGSAQYPYRFTFAGVNAIHQPSADATGVPA